MPRGRRTAAKPLSIGIAGSGELAPKTITALLDDLVGDSKPEALYVPVTDADYTDEVAAVVKWALDNEVPYTTISDEAAGKDKELKKVIAGGADDYDAGESAGKAIVELLAGDETDPVEDGRLLMFFDGDEDEDVAVFEEAHDLEVAAFDLRDGLSPMSFGDDGEPEPEADPEPEPEPEAPASRRGRRAASQEAKDDPTPEPEAEEATESREELLKLPLTELKKKAKAASKDNTTESMRGLKVADVVDLLLGPAEDEAGEPDEAQQTTSRRRGSRTPAATATEAVEPAEGDEEGDPEADSREEVFARLRGSRETAERIGAGLTASAKKALELDDEGVEELEKVAGLLAGAIMLFADFLVTEVRKPKSAGRPRKDGTEAQPAATPRRRRAASS